MFASLLFLSLTAIAQAPLLISVEDLGSFADAILVDTRSFEEYEAGHISGAVHLDPADLSEDKMGATGLLKSLDEVVQILFEKGLSPDKHLVLYSGMADNEDFKNATRIFWVLDYLGYEGKSILDGGIAKWRSENRPVSTESVTPVPADRTAFKIQPRVDLLVTRDQVGAAMQEQKPLLRDLRSTAEFRGDSKASYVSREGHIPGASCSPATEMVRPENGYYLVKPPEELATILGVADLRPDEPIITYCNTGRSGSVGYYALRLLGWETVALYDGSMSEWSTFADLPLETGTVETKE
jgi:thiosulfate/3-mercaptopyruvate sulfurtransferase